MACSGVLKDFSIGWKNGVEPTAWEFQLLPQMAARSEQLCVVEPALLENFRKVRVWVATNCANLAGPKILQKLDRTVHEWEAIDPTFIAEVSLLRRFVDKGDDEMKAEILACLPVVGGQYLEPEHVLKQMRGIAKGPLKDFCNTTTLLDVQTVINGLEPMQRPSGELDLRLLDGSLFVRSCAQRAIGFLKTPAMTGAASSGDRPILHGMEALSFLKESLGK